jgi:hypothetical protein
MREGVGSRMRMVVLVSNWHLMCDAWNRDLWSDLDEEGDKRNAKDERRTRDGRVVCGWFACKTNCNVRFGCGINREREREREDDDE